MRPLSASGAVAQTVVQPDELTADLEIPTVTDHENEPEEHVRIAAKIGVFSKGGQGETLLTTALPGG